MVGKQFLLDTQVLIWFFTDNLPLKTLDLLNNSQNTVYASVVNVWEMIIKKKKRKLRFVPNAVE